MITLCFERNEGESIRLSVSGHAGAALRGMDPVCAGVTALCYTLAQCLLDQRKLLREDPHIRIQSGTADMVACPTREGVADVEHTFRVVERGLRLLASNYPEHIKIQ